MIIFSDDQKRRGINLIRRVLEAFIFVGLPRPDQEKIMAHVDWMKTNPADMHVTCKLETIPETHTTIITIATTFQPSGPVLNG